MLEKPFVPELGDDDILAGLPSNAKSRSELDQQANKQKMPLKKKPLKRKQADQAYDPSKLWERPHEVLPTPKPDQPAPKPKKAAEKPVAAPEDDVMAKKRKKITRDELEELQKKARLFDEMQKQQKAMMFEQKAKETDAEIKRIEERRVSFRSSCECYFRNVWRRIPVSSTTCLTGR